MKRSFKDFIAITFLLSLFLGNSYAQNYIIDSLTQLLKNTKQDTSRCYILNAMIEVESDDAIWPKYNDELVKLAENKLKNSTRTSIERKVYQKYLAAGLNNIGYLANQQGDIPKALEYIDRGLKIMEEIGDKTGIAISLNNVGYIYSTQKDIGKALECYEKSLKLREEIGDKNGIGESWNNIGVLYKKDIGNTAKALECYQKSLKIHEEVDDKNGIAYALSNIGQIYFEQKEVSKAIDYWEKCLKIQEEIGDKRGIAFSLNSIGMIYLQQKNYPKALQFSTRSLKISYEIGYPENIQYVSKTLFHIYQATGNYKLALENYQSYIQMKDSLNNIETQKATIQQLTKYEFDKKKAIADKEHELELKQQENKAVVEKTKQNIIIGAVSIVLLLVAVFSVFLYNRFKVTQKQKQIIEVKEQETQQQKQIIEEKHKEITDSINYAERIQRSFLATQEHLNANLLDYFIIYKPKDIVSGDFYWSATLNNGCFALITADSTGHGVPGAIMSLLNITSLEKAIETCSEPSDILNATRKIIIERLKNDGSSEGGKDGMDCSLCVFDFKNLKLHIAAANNPVWILRANEVIEIKSDKMPVGKHDRQAVPFTQQTIDLQKGDAVYTLTDGYTDQFGGPKGKKFMVGNFRKLIQKIGDKPIKEQKQILESSLEDWQGTHEQVDDVLLIGVQV